MPMRNGKSKGMEKRNGKMVVPAELPDIAIANRDKLLVQLGANAKKPTQ